MKVVFFLPHPDDESVLCPVTLYKLVQRGHDVTLVLSTSDEYGTSRVEFKGERIRRIRRTEMYSAARVYGVDARGRFKIRVVWLGYIDGHLPVSVEARDRVERVLRDEAPDYVVTTDRWYPLDCHNDHLNTGALVLLAMRRLPPGDRPPLFVVQSLAPDHYQPFSGAEAKVAWRGFGKHRSQVSPLGGKLLNFARKFYFLFLRRAKAGRPAEAFRRVDPGSLREERSSPGLLLRMKLAFFRRTGVAGAGLYLPPPVDLGLEPLPVEVVDPSREG
ncbi:MAG: PIG-L deacetylase family protein [Promethearchaeota archaeon]